MKSPIALLSLVALAAANSRLAATVLVTGSDRGLGRAYQVATIYAQWGNIAKALEWLDTTVRLRDPGLHFLKTDPLMDPLRNEPRFPAVMRGIEVPGLNDRQIPRRSPGLNVR